MYNKIFNKYHFAVLFSLFFVITACAEKTTDPDTPIVQKGIVTTTLEVDGITRTYTLYIPESYTGSTSVPLVMCFHGYTGSATGIMNYSKFNEIAEKENFIMVYPHGTLLEGKSHWNVGGWTLSSKVDDVNFVNELLDSLSENYAIDPSKIYSTGMSNGGYMSFLIACRLNNRIAAIASVTGSMTPQTFNDCNPEHPTPIMQIHGDSDKTVPYDGDSNWTMSIDEVINYWNTSNQCNTSPVTTTVPDTNKTDGSTVQIYEYSGGQNGVVVSHYKVFGGGHDWPGAWGNKDISASEKIWDFFKRFDIDGAIE